ncbi:MAG: efflux RND transporter periplasmic adaptor subunit [Treponema sp.]|jgi:multidrug efflux pump subunit AcrA (membrane-fusion protein)|nr:efflux RND transporter periplasmic adaptor subunit [Treponema sp.]
MKTMPDFLQKCLFFGVTVLMFPSCARVSSSPETKILSVKAGEVSEKIVPDTVSGFGALSFVTKVDIAASQDGVVGRLYVREGDRISSGALAARLLNPQINLGVRRAEDGFSQAGAAYRLAKARLTEGEYAAEAELLGMAKAEAELAAERRILEEERRKLGDAEKLYAAGGISDEAIRENRFGLESAEDRIRILERELDIRRVGLRDGDLLAAGLLPEGGFDSPFSRSAALVQLVTLTLRAEADAAGAQLEAAGRELESARLALSELDLLSPASGIVGARYAEEGERVNRGDKLLTIIDAESLYAVFALREAEALRLRKGMDAVVHVDGTGKSYAGKLDLVFPQADSRSFTFSVRVLIPAAYGGDGGGGAGEEGGEKDSEETGGLKPGMFARTEVRAGPDRRVLAVPEEAIAVQNNGGATVFVIVNGRVSERKIQVGELFNDGRRELLSGLDAGEVVVLYPGASLKEGSRVVPEN